MFKTVDSIELKFWSLGFWTLGFVSDFEFRYLDLMEVHTSISLAIDLGQRVV